MKALDRETQSSYDLQAKVTDKGTPSLSSTALFSVVVEDSNDNSPKFVANQQNSVTVREDQAPGEVLLTFNATDADTGWYCSKRNDHVNLALAALILQVFPYP